MDYMVRSITFVRVADWLNAYVVRQHPGKEALRKKWMAADDRWLACAGRVDLPPPVCGTAADGGGPPAEPEGAVGNVRREERTR